MNIKYLISRLWRSKTVQKWINDHYSDNENLIVDRKFFPYIVTQSGEIFSLTHQIFTLHQTMMDYVFSDIQKDDIVIDLGANIGGFCIPAAKLSRNVYAIEPFTTDELRHNISKNNVHVNVIEGGLGNGTPSEVLWGVKKTIKTYTFDHIKSMCGGCDFLKCDCEGYEWFITPSDLGGIRRIEMEIHNFNPSPHEPKILLDAIMKEFQTSVASDRHCEKNDNCLNLNFKNHINRIRDIDEVAILHGKRY